MKFSFTENGQPPQEPKPEAEPDVNTEVNHTNSTGEDRKDDDIKAEDKEAVADKERHKSASASPER